MQIHTCVQTVVLSIILLSFYPHFECRWATARCAFDIPPLQPWGEMNFFELNFIEVKNMTEYIHEEHY